MPTMNENHAFHDIQRLSFVLTTISAIYRGQEIRISLIANILALHADIKEGLYSDKASSFKNKLTTASYEK